MHNNNDSVPTHRVALMGFTSFEQHALEAYIQLAHARATPYALASTLDEAQFVVANGDRVGVLDVILAAQRMGDTVLVGTHARQGAAAWLERPIDPLHLFRALDSAVQRRALAASAARVAPRHMTHAELGNAWPEHSARRATPASSGDLPWPTLMGLPALTKSPSTTAPSASTSSGPFNVEAVGASGTLRQTLHAVPKRVPPSLDEPLLALVVEYDDAAAAHMAVALQSHGIASLRAVDSRRAFAALQDQVFDLIVVDAALGPRSDLDGVSLCQAIKRQPRPYGEPCPPVLVTAADPSALEHAQAMVAGADVYLPKPLSAQALSQALEDTDLRVAMPEPLPRIA
jgi:CheY-like chemotaxis protein